ncbi:MAG TPA: hypothetical protein VLK34_06930 [Nocardioidaceae bacterium]|nr:hypothetical protein [Nocardioidaceae bacterium]
MADRPTDRAGVEEFASRHAHSALVTAYLLAGDWVSAQELAAHGLAAAVRTPGQDVAGADRRVAVAVARRHVRTRERSWSRDGGLHLQEVDAHPLPSADDPLGLWEGLSQLTELERAAIVLRGRIGMDSTSVAASLGRSKADVDRDLDTADGLIAQSVAQSVARRAHEGDRDTDVDPDVQRQLAALFTAQDAVRPPTTAVVERTVALDSRRRHAWLLATAAGAVAVVLVSAVGVSVLASSDEEARPTATSSGVPSELPGWVPEPQQPSLPDVGPHRKLVGYQTVVLAVPSSWVQVASTCGAITRNAVIFPAPSTARLCDDKTIPTGLSAVSFNRDIAGEPEVQGDFGPRLAHAGEFLVTTPTHRHGRYVAYTSAPELGFGMSVTTRSKQTLDRIIGSITVLPANYTIVPQFVGLAGERLETAVYGHRLVPERRPYTGPIGLTLEVQRQSQSVGTVVPVQTQITLGMRPR